MMPQIRNTFSRPVEILLIQIRSSLRNHSKTTSTFAGGEWGFRQGATKERSQSSVTEEQPSLNPNSPPLEGQCH